MKVKMSTRWPGKAIMHNRRLGTVFLDFTILQQIEITNALIKGMITDRI